MFIRGCEYSHFDDHANSRKVTEAKAEQRIKPHLWPTSPALGHTHLFFYIRMTVDQLYSRKPQGFSVMPHSVPEKGFPSLTLHHMSTQMVINHRFHLKNVLGPVTSSSFPVMFSGTLDSGIQILLQTISNLICHLNSLSLGLMCAKPSIKTDPYS